MSDSRLLRNVRLLGSSVPVNILLGHGFILAIEPCEEAVLCSKSTFDIQGRGMCVVPAMIDIHTHSRVPGPNEAETAETFFQSAIVGGVAAIGLMPNTGPAISTHENLELADGLMGQSRVQRKFWFGATPDNAKEIASVAKDPRVAGVKMYMGSSTGGLLVSQEHGQHSVMRTCAELGLRLVVHAEDEDMMISIRNSLGRKPSVADHCKIRRTEVEVSAVKQALRLVEQTGCTVHFAHISTPESLELIFDAKCAGLPVTCEVCVHHLIFDESKTNGGAGGFWKMNPPLRTMSQMYRLKEYLGCDGFVDVIATDHAPHTRMAKVADDYDSVPSGVTGLQHMFPLLMTLTQHHSYMRRKLIDLTVKNPAHLLGMKDRGEVAPGNVADLVLFDDSQEASNTIWDRDTVSKCGWSPYHGMDVVGMPKIVILGGEVVYEAPH